MPGAAPWPDGYYLGLISYGPNAGTKPYADPEVTDGVCHNNTRVRLDDVADGTSSTLLFGEHSRSEPGAQAAPAS